MRFSVFVPDESRSRKAYRKIPNAVKHGATTCQEKYYGWISRSGRGTLCTTLSHEIEIERRSSRGYANPRPDIVYKYVTGNSCSPGVDGVQAQLDFLCLLGWIVLYIYALTAVGSVKA